MRIVIVGAGLAGLSCAGAVLDAGCEVTLVETRRDGALDLGARPILGAYTELIRLLEAAGLADELAWLDQIELRDAEDGARAVVGLSLLRSPAPTLGGLFGYGEYLAPAEKVGLLPLFAPVMRPVEDLRRDYDLESVAGWFARSSGNPVLFERVVRPLCRSLFLAEPSDVSAFELLTQLRHVKRAGEEGRAAILLSDGDGVLRRLARSLERRGVRFADERGVVGIEVGRGATEVGRVRVGQRSLEAEAFVLAIPPWEIARALSPGLSAPWDPAAYRDLPTVPVISVELFLDRLDGPAAYALVAHGACAAYALSVPRALGRTPSVRAVLTGTELSRERDDALTRAVYAELALLDDRVGEARVLGARVTKATRAALRPAPGTASAGAPARLATNLFVASPWSDPEFLGSEEGVVRGGLAAARAALSASPNATRGAGRALGQFVSPSQVNDKMPH